MLKTEDIEEFIDQNSERLKFDSWVSIEHRFLYINTPKVGCTKVKKLLQAIYGFEVPEEVGPIHQREGGGFVKSLLDYTLSEQIYLLQSPEVCRFCFVRNPYERLLSSYKSKVIGPKKYGTIQEILKDRRNAEDQSLPTFSEFVDYVSILDDSEHDIHWRSLYSLLHFDKINYNYIGRFECFQKDLHTLLLMLNADTDIISSISKIENPSDGITMEEAYTSHLYSKIYTMYELDFKTFNYNPIYRK